MNVVFYFNSSAVNVLNKNIVEVFTADCNIVDDEFSISNPALLIEYSNISALIGTVNYVHVPEFGRYYYITDYVINNNDLVTIKLKCDVLMSFKSVILSNSGIVSRQENDWNLYLNDDHIKCYQNSQIQTLEYPRGFSGWSNVLVCAGG